MIRDAARVVASLVGPGHLTDKGGDALLDAIAEAWPQSTLPALVRARLEEEVMRIAGLSLPTRSA